MKLLHCRRIKEKTLTKPLSIVASYLYQPGKYEITTRLTVMLHKMNLDVAYRVGRKGKIDRITIFHREDDSIIVLSYLKDLELSVKEVQEW